jgi:hypothetical protein
MSVLKSFFDDGHTAVRRWKAYKERTGEIPWLWVSVHVVNGVIPALLFLMWLTHRYPLSEWQFFGVFVVVTIPYGILWYRAKDTVKFIHLRKQRHGDKIRLGQVK